MTDDLAYFYQGRKYEAIPLGNLFVDRLQETEGNPRASTFVVQVQNISDKAIKEIVYNTNLPEGTVKVKSIPKELEPGQMSEVEFDLFPSKIMDRPASEIPENVYFELEYSRELWR